MPLLDPLQHEWQPTVTLHPDQLAAIYHPGNVVIDAGAGSGKTEVLTHLIMHRLQTGAVAEPKRILMLSYKRDAARLLQDRIREKMPDHVHLLDCITLDALVKGLIDRFRLALPAEWRLDPYKLNFKSLSKVGLHNFQPTTLTSQSWANHMRGPVAQASFPMLARLGSILLTANPQLLSLMRSTFGLVVVDEVQDTTEPQFELLRTAFSGSSVQVVAVGDDRQRIMRFAGALPDALTSFEQAFDATRFHLRMNYRSKSRLVQVQAAALQGLGFKGVVPQEVPPDRDGGEFQIVELPDERAEAEFAAQQISEWLRADLPPRSAAVLVRDRTRVQPGPLIAHLRSLGVAARDDDKLQDLNAEMLPQLILDALEAVCMAPSRPAWLRLLQVFRDLHGKRLGWQEEGPVKQLNNLQKAVRHHISEFSPTVAWVRELADTVANTMGGQRLGVLYPPYLDAEYLATVSQWFAEAFAPMLQQGNVAAAVQEFRGANFVPILTIHKAKGLQFHSVLVLGVEDEHYRDKETGIVTQDEASNLFVAISRPVERLILTRCRTRQRKARSWHELDGFYQAVFPLV